jgi:acetyl esterase
MPRQIPPTPISLGQRAGVSTLRALMAIFKLSTSLRSHPTPPGTISFRDYGPHRDERLEYIPRLPGSPERAAVIYIHGGGWIAGKKELYTSDLFFLAEAGHPVFNLEYPMAPENPHPGMLLCLLGAMRWIRHQYPEIVDGVHFMGDSAGGNLALMMGVLARNPHLIKDFDSGEGESSPGPCHSVVSLYGVLDRLSWLKNGFPGSRLMLDCYGGKAAFEQEVGPDLAITPMDLEFEAHPPSFLTAGTADQLCESSQICADRLRKGSGVVLHKEFAGERHGFFNFKGRSAYSELRSDILGFLAEHDPA